MKILNKKKIIIIILTFAMLGSSSDRCSRGNESALQFVNRKRCKSFTMRGVPIDN
jgi:hypothetical protein